MTLELSKYLIAHSIEIPAVLQTKIEQQSLIAQIIQFYMSIAADYKGLLSFLGSQHQINFKLTKCAEQDI
jgi:hypothetical protein